MTYSLFIDDERDPGQRKPPVGNKWVIVRCMSDTIKYINSAGWPGFISFDHDLGYNEPTGHDIVKWIIEQDLEFETLPTGFKFDVHSQNPVGAKNIVSHLNNYLTWKKHQ
jgi:hypothetical protein